ncbi:MAG: hypothetical protein D6815_01880 [Candidatus Dadabacteria bacterium]|nr:MAG: hypothetical protein D6815_01880 [Candidatus Dadabacteria bacterium]
MVWRPGPRTDLLNVPNTITLLRLFAVPVFLSLLAEGDYRLALLVFVAAGLTDAVDGAVARLTDSRTELGAHLDPLADKLLLVSAFITLGVLGAVPVQLMIIVLVRDAVILGGFILSAIVFGKPVRVAPSVWGKATTFFQIVSVSLVLVIRTGWYEVSEPLLSAVFLITGLLTFLSGAHYVIYGVRWYQSSEAGT